MGRYSMNRLEERYRTVLRVLPESYRRQWEEDMVSAFLESTATDDPEHADYLADFGRPGLGEVASVLALGTRLRLGIGVARPQSPVWRAAIQVAVLAGLLTHAVFGASDVVVRWWLSAGVSWLPAPPSLWLEVVAPPLVALAWLAAGLAWLAAFVALLFGQRDIARWLAAAAMIPSVVIGTFAGPVDSVELWFGWVFNALLLLGMSAFPARGPRARRVPWLAGLVVGSVATAAIWIFLISAGTPTIPPLDWPTECCAALVVAAVAHLAMPGARRGRYPAATLALALLAAAAFGTRVATLLDYLSHGRFDEVSDVVAVGTVAAVAVLAVGVPLVVIAASALRRLAPTATATVTLHGEGTLT